MNYELRTINYSTRQGKFEARARILWIIVICGLFILLGRIAWLQLIEGERYFRISQNSRLQLLPLSSPRGLILDRRGEKLAENEVLFSVGVVPSNVFNLEQLLPRLTQALDIDKQRIREKLQEAPNPFRPVFLKENVDISTITYLLEREKEFPGTVIIAQPVRSYPYKMVAAHLLGYLGEVDQAELSMSSGIGIELGDLVGKMGIEKVYNLYLQGEKGGRQVEVDAYGRSLRIISEKDPLPGDNIYLTIDLRIQKIAEEELGQRKGVVLIGDPETGELLALVSHSGFDPNLFSRGISEDEWNRLKQDLSNPLENRAIRGEYSPASIFKIILAAAALEENIIKKEDTFFCPGSLLVGRRSFKCWEEEGHGRLDLERAIIHSCDVFFYQLGLKVGVEKMIEYAELFGLGEATGLNLIQEKYGLLPTSDWKLKNKGEIWYGGDTANLSIGQGYILVTPLQMLRVISAVANGGNLVKPYLVKKIENLEGEVIKDFSPPKKKKISLSSSTLSFLKKSLRGVVREGTGWRAENRIVNISGKTGTVELSEGERPHNWFIGYAPSDNPRLAIVVLVEHREEDISIAAQIAGKIFSQTWTQINADGGD